MHIKYQYILNWLIEFKVNGTSYTVLKLLGEGGYSQVLPGFWYLIGTDGKKYNSSFKCDQVYEVYNADREIFALKIVNLKVSIMRMQLGQHDPLINVILTNDHAVKVFGIDGVQCGDEGGADPGDSLSRENEKVQTRGDLFPDISIDYVESQVRAFEYEIKETCEENKVFLLMEKGKWKTYCTVITN